MHRSLFVSFTLLASACSIDDVPQSGAPIHHGLNPVNASSSDEDTGEVEDTADTADTSDTGDSAECEESIWYADQDGDGFGNAAASVSSCTQPSGFVDNDDDLDDTLAVVGSTPTHAVICVAVDIGYAFSFWWDDTEMSESNTWLDTSHVDSKWTACKDVTDFRPTHLFGLNGYYKGAGNEDEWLVAAGNTSHISAVMVGFDDGSYDMYNIDTTGAVMGVGTAYYQSNGDGGGNLYFEAEPDFNGEYN